MYRNTVSSATIRHNVSRSVIPIRQNLNRWQNKYSKTVTYGLVVKDSGSQHSFLEVLQWETEMLRLSCNSFAEEMLELRRDTL